jgi:hypothetical protein
MCRSFAPNFGEKLPGINIGKRANKTVVVAYADKVTIFVTLPTELPIIHYAILCYEKATGARLNTKKSKALTVGGWSTTTVPLGIPYANEVKILGITFSNTTEQSTKKSWAIVTNRVRAQAMNTYARDLCLSQRIRYVHTYRLAKIWYTAQIFPAPITCTQQLNTAITWYIWKGTTFRVPLSTLHRPKKQGGWGLIDIRVKSRALLIERMWLQSSRNGSATATWHQEWKLTGPKANPPHVERIPTKLEYLYQYIIKLNKNQPDAHQF